VTFVDLNGSGKVNGVHRSTSKMIVVPEVGLEPTQGFPYRILRPYNLLTSKLHPQYAAILQAFSGAYILLASAGAR
jgi:hypothetical protein